MSMAEAMLFVASNTNPINGVKIAPPMIAITMHEPPSLVFGPNSFNPSAKIVGNINDMKKLVRKIAQSPIQPGKSTPVPTSMTLIRL